MCDMPKICKEMPGKCFHMYSLKRAMFRFTKTVSSSSCEPLIKMTGNKVK